MYTPSPHSVRNRWRTYNALADTAEILERRHYPFPDLGKLDFDRDVQLGAGSDRGSRVEVRLAQGLQRSGFDVTRKARVTGLCAPFCDRAALSLSPDLIVNGGVIIEVDTPKHLRGGPTHTMGFPAKDMVRMDFFRALGFATVALRLWGLSEIPDHTSVCGNQGLRLRELEQVVQALNRKLGVPPELTLF